MNIVKTYQRRRSTPLKTSLPFVQTPLHKQDGLALNVDERVALSPLPLLQDDRHRQQLQQHAVVKQTTTKHENMEAFKALFRTPPSSRALSTSSLVKSSHLTTQRSTSLHKKPYDRSYGSTTKKKYEQTYLDMGQKNPVGTPVVCPDCGLFYVIGNDDDHSVYHKNHMDGYAFPVRSYCCKISDVQARGLGLEK